MAVVNKLAEKYLRMLKPYTMDQIRKNIFNNCLETQQDGVIEFYEFIEVMRLIELCPGKTLMQLAPVIKEIRTGVVCDPKHPRFGRKTLLKIPTMPEERRQEFKEAFKFLDSLKTRDGVITLQEIFEAISLL